MTMHLREGADKDAAASAEAFEIPAAVKRRVGRKAAVPRPLCVKITRGADGRARFVSLGYHGGRYDARITAHAILALAQRIGVAEDPSVPAEKEARQ